MVTLLLDFLVMDGLVAAEAALELLVLMLQTIQMVAEEVVMVSYTALLDL